MSVSISRMSANIQTLFDAGAHIGFSRTRRHPTAAPFLFSTKDRTDIFNLEETESRLNRAGDFAAQLAQNGRQVLFVGGKHEAITVVRDAAERAGQPYVAGRWIGGTLTNFKNIRKRIDRLEKLMAEKESGELDKYTKKERLLLDREIEELQGRFGGIVSLKDLPGALFVVDTRHENTAVLEAKQMGVPVIGLSSSDCDFSLVKYPIPANDTSVQALKLIVDDISVAYQRGKKAPTK